MNEEFIYYLWGFRLLEFPLMTTSGEEVHVVFPGERNPNSGPDFTNARIRIGETLWVGNVEIHVRSSDWYLHNHQDDQAFSNVILHVVYEDDLPPASNVGSPTVVIKGRYDQTSHERYLHFQTNKNWIPCQDQFHQINRVDFETWSTALAAERLEERMTQWEVSFLETTCDWETTFYIEFAKVFGLKINSLPFEILAKSLPLSVIRKHRNNSFQLEALVFGVAGFLNHAYSEEYPGLLSKEFSYLAKKYHLRPMELSMWKFMRLRPSGFPTIRIAQWALLLQQMDDLFSSLLTEFDIKAINKRLSVRTSSYWDNHYRFDKLSVVQPKLVGDGTIHSIWLNFIIPFLFFYGNQQGNIPIRARAFELLDQLPSEENSIIDRWIEIGVATSSAMHSQALLQLKSRYCDRKRCLACRFGVKLVRGE